MRFYLGTHKPHWLAKPEFANIPLFVSRRRLREYAKMPKPVGAWAIDSGGFTELSMHGGWTIDAPTYVSEIRRFISEAGRAPDFVAPMDWMCEPHIVEKTGLDVATHQRLTVENYVQLKALAPEVPWIPVVQGFTPQEYVDCLWMYNRAGVNLWTEPLVGIGSVCRRQAANEIEELVGALGRSGLRIHGFGVKLKGLERIATTITSSDSLAWSFDARYSKTGPLPGCKHASCANCSRWAIAYYERVQRLIAGLGASDTTVSACS